MRSGVGYESRRLTDTLRRVRTLDPDIDSGVEAFLDAAASDNDELLRVVVECLGTTVEVQRQALGDALSIIKEMLPGTSFEQKRRSSVSMDDSRVKYAWMMTSKMMDLGFVISPARKRFLFATPSVEKILGWSPRDLVEGEFEMLEYVFVCDRPKFVDFLESLRDSSGDNAGPVAILVRFEHKDQSKGTVSLQLRASEISSVGTETEVAIIAREDSIVASVKGLQRRRSSVETIDPDESVPFSANSMMSPESSDSKLSAIKHIGTKSRERSPSISLSKIYSNAGQKAKADRSIEVVDDVLEPSVEIHSCLSDVARKIKNKGKHRRVRTESERKRFFTDTTDSFSDLEIHHRTASSASEIGYKDLSRVVTLPRGGIIVNTDAGPVQFGIPPESIKDSMAMGLEVPTTFVLPKVMFDRDLGINMAEFEFPSYFNFFIKRKCINLVTTPQMAERIRSVFRETLLGPKEYTELESEFLGDDAFASRPDLIKECAYFARNPFDPPNMMTVDTILKFTFFDDHGRAVISKDDSSTVVEVVDLGDEFAILENKEEKFRCSVDIPLPRFHVSWTSRPSDSVLQRLFKPPDFGVTFLGTSDGFDPHGTTTGFVLWINGRGYCVDPPVHSGAILKLYGM
jgi:hypothetical protein